MRCFKGKGKVPMIMKQQGWALGKITQIRRPTTLGIGHGNKISGITRMGTVTNIWGHKGWGGGGNKDKRVLKDGQDNKYAGSQGWAG